MKRRGFLSAAIAAVAVGGAGAATLYKMRREPAVRSRLLAWFERIDPLARRIHEHFSELTLDTAGVDAFVEDYRALGFESLSTRDNSDFYLTYLASTDYFDETRVADAPLAYVAFFHPYVSPCRNPFARFDDDA